MKVWAILGVTAALVFGVASSQAADIIVGEESLASAQCGLAADSTLMATTDRAGLKDAVVSRMDQAISVAKDPDWIASSRPIFVWASETKVACGKAFGYLKNGYQDAETISKCDCFHSRMVQYMN